MLILGVKLDFTSENLKFRFKETYRKSQVLRNKLVAMVTPDILGKQK